jgi:CubicO group peptidase (beta-lactamase class C family)
MNAMFSMRIRPLLAGLLASLLLLQGGAGKRAFAAETAVLKAGEPGGAIAERLKHLVDEGAVSGAVALVANQDAILHWSAVGKSDLSSGRAMEKQDLFWIASMTKPMTAVCVMQLAEAGRLSIEDPLEKILPEFRGMKVEEKGILSEPARLVQVRDLLTHTAGLAEFKPAAPDATLADLCAGYARQPLRFQPGSRWSYSNPAVNTLGRIVEVLSGMSFSDYLQEYLLNPLGMVETTFWPSEESQVRLAKSYKLAPDRRLEETSVLFIQGPLGDRSRTAFPAGGLFSTARDVVRFYQMMLNGGTLDGKTVLKKATVAQMTRTQTGEIQTGFVDGMSWGLGFQVVRYPQGVTAMLGAGTFGHGGAYGTQSWADPAQGLAYVLLIQRAGLKNGDASEMRQVFQESAVEAFAH